MKRKRIPLAKAMITLLAWAVMMIKLNVESSAFSLNFEMNSSPLVILGFLLIVLILLRT